MERRQRAQYARARDENVELAPALKQRRSDLVDLVAAAQIERKQGGLAAGGADLVVELFQPPDRPRRDHHVRTLFGQGQRHGAADATRGTRDEGEAVLERFLGLHGSHRSTPTGYSYEC